MSAEPTPEQLRSAPVLPGFELPDSVTLTRGVVLGDGMQPEDVGVLAWLKLRDPRRPATQEELAKEMQAAGWKMGKTRFAGIFQRLKSLGHIRHVSVYNPDTGRPEWRIEFYLNPANNAQYVDSGISSFPQAGDGSLESGDSQTDGLFGSPETGVSRGQKESRVSGDSLPDPRKPGIPSDVVPAGQARNPENPVFGSHPPHPPEGEEGTSSPVGKTATASRREKTQQRHDEAQLETAAAFLMRLPGKWAAGVQRSRNLAPLLLENTALTGWDLDLSLRMYLARPEPGKKQPDNYGAVLAHRVKNLKPRTAVLEAAAEDEQQEPTQEPQTPQAPAWCGECDSDSYRWIAPETGPARKCPACNPQAAGFRS